MTGSPPRISSFLSTILGDSEDGDNEEELVDDVDEVKELIGSAASLDITAERRRADSPLGLQKPVQSQSSLGEKSVAHILSAASKAVKDKTDIAYRRY